MRALLTRNEPLVALVIVAYCIATALVDPSFLSLDTLFDLLRAAIVPGILGIAVLLVLLSGGIDVSFTAVAVFSMYTTAKLMTVWGLGDSIVVPFVLSAAIGLALGAVNAVFIALFGLPTLIVTLGTLSAFPGFLRTFVGTELISNVPRGMRDFSRLVLFRGETADGAVYSLHAAVLFLVAVVVVTWLLLYRTMLGRSIFALGGSREAAARVGFNVRATQFFIYGYVGALAGLAGILHGSLARVANPYDLVGLELSVIAAVVLGGARLAGGFGTITGTLLGTALIVLISNTLIVLGIPSTWQNVAIGLMILLGTGVPAIQARRKAQEAGA